MNLLRILKLFSFLGTSVPFDVQMVLLSQPGTNRVNVLLEYIVIMTGSYVNVLLECFILNLGLVLIL